MAEIVNANMNTAIFKARTSTNNLNSVWIGLTDTDSEGIFVWPSTGQTAAYTNFRPGQPDNGSQIGGGEQNCGRIWSRGVGDWDDETCTRILNFLCEKS